MGISKIPSNKRHILRLLVGVFRRRKSFPCRKWCHSYEGSTMSDSTGYEDTATPLPPQKDEVELVQSDRGAVRRAAEEFWSMKAQVSSRKDLRENTRTILRTLSLLLKKAEKEKKLQAKGLHHMGGFYELLRHASQSEVEALAEVLSKVLPHMRKLYEKSKGPAPNKPRQHARPKYQPPVPKVKRNAA